MAVLKLEFLGLDQLQPYASSKPFSLNAIGLEAEGIYGSRPLAIDFIGVYASKGFNTEINSWKKPFLV